MIEERTNPLVIGLDWKTENEAKYKVIDALVPSGRIFFHYWYTPSPSDEDAAENANEEILASISVKDGESGVTRYLNAVKNSIQYPLFWDVLQIRLPLLELFNIKVGSEGDNIKSRISFQVLDQLLQIYGRLPGFSFDDLAEKVKEIAALPTPYDMVMTEGWSDNVEAKLEELDEEALLRHAGYRLKFMTRAYEQELESQWQAYEEEAEDHDEPNAIADKLPKRLCVLIPDVKTEKDIKLIKDQDDAILVSVINEGDPHNEDADCIITIPDREPDQQAAIVVSELQDLAKSLGELV
jgi:hypothetical protein